MGRENGFFLVAACCVIVLGAGCAGLMEAGRGIVGVSTKVLEDGRQNAVRKVYPVNYMKCRKTVDDVLADNKAYVYARNDQQKMIAFYMSETDTTPVGVFFIVHGEASTEVEVSSPSRYAKQFIADKISAGFDKVLRSERNPAVSDSQAVAADQEEKEMLK